MFVVSTTGSLAKRTEPPCGQQGHRTWGQRLGLTCSLLSLSLPLELLQREAGLPAEGLAYVSQRRERTARLQNRNSERQQRRVNSSAASRYSGRMFDSTFFLRPSWGGVDDLAVKRESFRTPCVYIFDPDRANRTCPRLDLRRVKSLRHTSTH